VDHTSSLTELLSRARRRWLAHSLLDQFALAAAIGMGGAILLLLAGTQILDWYWVVLLVAASLGVGVYRLLQTVPSTYKLAQRIDHGLKLTDALSTATYFSSVEARGDELVRKRQREEADAIARTVDVRRGVPFLLPRYLYPALALAAVACGLFAVRYAMTGSMNLQPSLVKIALDTFFPSRQEAAKANAKKQADRAKQAKDDPTSADSPTAQEELALNQQMDQPEATDATNPDGQEQANPDADGQSPDPNAADKDDKSDKGDTASAGNDAKQDDNGQDDNSNGGKEQNAKNNSNKGSDKENSSLLNKVKDAMSDMWSKMTQKDAPQTNSKSGQQGGQPDKSSQKNAQSQKKGENSDNDAKGEQQQGDGGDQKQAASGASEKGSDATAQPDSKSGIGSSDGDKAAREAAQLAAMGKISELLGKRAQNISGEVMVEVGSSKQQLKTPWAQRQATHIEAGSEIHRDEVPLMYQQFVQQYFEEIRKTPDTSSATKPAGTKAAPKPTKPS
jgi:hypothetical protein